MTTKAIIRSIILIQVIWLLGLGYAHAQRNTLQNDPVISWMAEFTTDYSFNATSSSQQEIIQITKLINDPSNTNQANITDWLMHGLLEDAINSKVIAYADPGLSDPLSEEDLSQIVVSIDTIIVFDPKTFEEQVHIVKNELDFSSIKTLRVNQVIYYNEKSKDFGTQVLAVAPLILTEDTGNLKPLFWIKMDQAFPSNFNMHSENITWGAIGYSRANPLNLNFTDETKNSNKINFKETVYKQATELKKPVESSEGFGCNTFLTQAEVLTYYNSIDTVTTFDPKTFEESVMIIKNDFNYNEINEFRLVQEWYYDVKSKKLFNRLRAISPIVEVKNEKKNFQYSRPLYYIRYGKVDGLKRS